MISARFCFVVLASGIVALLSQTAQPAPQYDRYGQSIKADFPEKVTTDEELKEDIDRDKTSYASFSPLSLDTYGGLAGSKEKYGLKATGFFSIQKIDDRFTLATPEGNRYFALTVGGLMTYHTQMYIIETAIPFEAFGVDPESGTEFDFHLRVNDADGQTRYSILRKYDFNGRAVLSR